MTAGANGERRVLSRWDDEGRSGQPYSRDAPPTWRRTTWPGLRRKREDMMTHGYPRLLSVVAVVALTLVTACSPAAPASPTAAATAKPAAPTTAPAVASPAAS